MSIISTALLSSLCQADQYRVLQNYAERCKVAEVVEKIFTWYGNTVPNASQNFNFLSKGRIAIIALQDVTNPESFSRTKELTCYFRIFLQNQGLWLHEAHLTNNEVDHTVRIVFETLRHINPTTFNTLFNAISQIREEDKSPLYFEFFARQMHQVEKTVKSIYPLIIQEITQAVPPQMQAFVNFIPVLVQQFGVMPIDKLETMSRPIFAALHQLSLDNFNEGRAVPVASIEEMRQVEIEERICAFVAKFAINETFSVSTFLESLVRQFFSYDFFKVIQRKIALNTPDEPKLLTLFDRLIEDYISQGRSLHWRFDVAHNFGYSHDTLDGAIMAGSAADGQKRVNRFDAAQQFIQNLEVIFKGFIERVEVFTALKAALPALLFVDTEVWWTHCEAHHQPKWDLVEYSIQTGFVESLFRYLLKDVAISDAMMKRIHNFKICNYIRLHVTEDLPFTPNAEEQALLDRIYPIFDRELAKCVDWAKRFQQTTNPQLPILGIGFSGNHFDLYPAREKNEVFVSFTYKILQGDPVPSQAFLLATGAFLEARSKYEQLNERDSWSLTSEFESLINENPGFYLHVLDQPKEEEQGVINYIGEKIFAAICRDPSNVHPEILASYRASIAEHLKVEQNQLQKSCDDITSKPMNPRAQKASQKLQERINLIANGIGLVEAGNFHQLSEQLLEQITKILKVLNTRICVESMINHLAGTPFTLSFAMGETKVPAISLKGESYNIKGRRLVQPCSQRCQIMSPAHTLWGELNHFPTAQQMDQRNRAKGGKGL